MTSIPQDLVATTSIAPEHRKDMELAAKYACQGPRYTSYPTAPQFNTDFCQAGQDWLETEAGNSSAPLSLYIHLPFCNDICYYCGCNKKITRHARHGVTYLNWLDREIE